MFSGKEFSIHVVPKFERNFVIYKSMGECNTIQSAYTKYRHLG